MARGQAERIMMLLETILTAKSRTWADLDAIGVGVGPGNFTGIRISVSAARGLALGLGIPAVPVSSFETQRDPWGIAAHAAELVSVEAPRGAAYVQPFRYGTPTGPAETIDPYAPPDHLRRVNLEVTGFCATQIADRLGGSVLAGDDTIPLADRIARIAEWKLANGYDTKLRPAPLYVKAPDAAPPREKPPVILP